MNRRVLFVLLAVGCGASRARPASMHTLDRMMASPGAREVARDAPAANAELLASVRAAERAQDDGDPGAADARTEAELTFEWALTQARAARARAGEAAARQRGTAAETDASRMEQQAAQFDAEAALRVDARRTAERVREGVRAPAGVPPAERVARAEELRQEAALLVAAARLLGASAEAIAPVEQRITAAEGVARARDATPALVAAGQAYAAAEALVRTTREGHPSPEGATDGVRLAGELSGGGGFDPHRDARGVIAVFRGLFRGTRLVETSRSRVESLARVIQGHADARVRVEAFVGGPDRARAAQAALAQARALVAALVRAGVPAGRLQAEGLYRVPGGAREDDRVEVVLALPSEP